MAAAARRAGSLTAGGQWAAFATGTLVAAAGWRWAALLIGYFVLSSALTRAGAARKAARTAAVLPAAGARNATQVAANGAVFTVLVLAGEWWDAPALLVGGIGAIAAAAADTWATEVGTLWGGVPRSILTMRPMAPGESGGVTPAGTLASAMAAAAVAVAAAALLPGAALTGVEARAVLAAGLAGSVGDSLLGAIVQSKRWCEPCRTWTERRVHTCHHRTQHAKGVRWVTNDTVNLLATLVGAGTALAVVGVP